MKKTKICLVFAGGTMAMEYDKKTGSLKPSKSHKDLLLEIPEINEIAEIGSVFITDIDSTNMIPSVWNKIATEIYNKIDEFDGFVVTHGTDTMAYTASAVSFILQNISKPIVFTGSQLPLADKTRSEARSNLLFATHFATMELNEVCIFFGTKLLRGNRAHKYSQFDFDAFTSYNAGIIGKTGIKPILYDHRLISKSKITTLHLINDEKQVALLKYFPGMKPEVISSMIDLGYDGIVIEGAGPGNLPTNKDFAGAIISATKKNIPIVIKTQCEIGQTDLDTYEVGKLMKKAGAISASDMTTEATVTKLLWVLSMKSDIEQVKKLMESDVAGEMTV